MISTTYSQLIALLKIAFLCRPFANSFYIDEWYQIVERDTNYVI